jgi:hypothetical protein
VVTDVPVGIALGLAAPCITAMFPAANGFCFLPATPNLLAAVFIDRTAQPELASMLSVRYLRQSRRLERFEPLKAVGGVTTVLNADLR